MEDDVIAEWFDAYSDDIYKFLVYYMSTTDVEDIVQEVFIKDIDRYDSFRGDSTPKTWLITIARHLAIDKARERKRKDWRNLITSYDYKADVSPEEEQITEESRSELHSKINKMKDAYRDVVILRGIKELSVAETADILKWSQSKVRVTFHRALKTLKLKVEEDEHE